MLRHTVIATLGVTMGLAAPAAAQVAGTIGSIVLGGTSGQTIRLVLTANDTTVGCSAWAGISTRDGASVLQELVTLRPGESSFVEVDLGRLTGGLRRRVELLPAVKVIDSRCSAAAEIIENATGRKLAHMPGLLLPASGTPPSAMSVSLSQVVRLGALRGFDPQPDPPACRGVLAFTDADGRAVGPSQPIDLEPGESSFVDLDPSLLLPASGDPLRAGRIVRPQLLPASTGGDARGCRVSVQLIDRVTGRTTGAVMPR